MNTSLYILTDPFALTNKCPFPEGQYQFTYITTTGSVQCENVYSSVADVTSSQEIAINSCYTGPVSYG